MGKKCGKIKIQSIQCVNNVDPITLESIEDILPDNLIRLKIGKKLRFYNVQALYRWIKIDPVDPTTKIPFSRCQINKIKMVYGTSTSQNIDKCISNFLISFNQIHLDTLTKGLDCPSLGSGFSLHEYIQQTDLRSICKNNKSIIDSLDVKEVLNDDEFKNTFAIISGISMSELNPLFERFSENPDIVHNIAKNLVNSLSE